MTPFFQNGKFLYSGIKFGKSTIIDINHAASWRKMKRGKNNARQNRTYHYHYRRSQLGKHRTVRLRRCRMDMRRTSRHSQQDHLHNRRLMRYMVHFSFIQREKRDHIKQLTVYSAFCVGKGFSPFPLSFFCLEFEIIELSSTRSKRCINLNIIRD